MKANPAIRGCSRLEPKGRQSSPGRLTWPGAHSENCRCSRAHLNPPVSNAEHGKAVASGPRRSWPPQQGREAEPAWRRPKKPMPPGNVTDMPTSARCRMAQNMWNRLQLGKANDERRPSLGASRSCRPMERNPNGRRPVLPSCPSRLPCLLRMPGNLSSSGSPRTRLALERLELCEAKVSCTVLRGVRAG